MFKTVPLIDDLMLIVGRVVTERRFRTPRRLVLLQGGKPNYIASEALPPEKPAADVKEDPCIR